MKATYLVERKVRSMELNTCKATGTYCTAGALWTPPLKCAGITTILVFTALPSWWTAVPVVPAWPDTAKGSDSCQHSRIDSPSAAEMAVRLRYVDAAVVLAINWRMNTTKTIDAAMETEKKYVYYNTRDAKKCKAGRKTGGNVEYKAGGKRQRKGDNLHSGLVLSD